jgi:hypothetical protein
MSERAPILVRLSIAPELTEEELAALVVALTMRPLTAQTGVTVDPGRWSMAGRREASRGISPGSSIGWGRRGTKRWP